LLRALDPGAINMLPQLSGFTLNLAVFAVTAFASSWVLARGIAIPASWGRSGAAITSAAPWSMRFVGWMWVVLLVWLYVMANVLVFGAEVNWWRTYGRRSEQPDEVPGLA